MFKPYAHNSSNVRGILQPSPTWKQKSVKFQKLSTSLVNNKVHKADLLDAYLLS